MGTTFERPDHHGTTNVSLLGYDDGKPTVLITVGAVILNDE
jgi:hypothetical protein